MRPKTKTRTQRKTKQVLVLRTCDADGKSHGGFQWPKRGAVKCDDWNPVAQCGNGLHGLLWGSGDVSLLSSDETARWLVVSVPASKIVDLSGKVEFPSGSVVFCGSREKAVALIASKAPPGTAVVYATATAGNGGTATAGYRGTATAGYRGTATAGDGGTATAGNGGTATAGDRGTIAIRYWDDAKSKWRTAIGEVGENGIEPNVPYHVVDGKLVRKP